MINLKNNLAISYGDGYFQIHKHGITESGSPSLKLLGTYPSINSCHKALLDNNCSVGLFEGVCEKLVEDYPLELAKIGAKAKKRFAERTAIKENK